MPIKLRSQYRSTPRAGADPFTDLLFNTLIGVMLLFLIAIIFLNPMDDAGKIDIEAEYIVTVTWPDHSPDDIDTWVQDPKGNITWFRNRSIGLVHLDRDDRGMLNDTMVLNGQTVENPLNQEVTAIRGLVPGEYVVNVHYYESETNSAVPVSVRVAKVNPVYTIAYYGVTTLEGKGDEQTAVRFTINADGTIGGINQLPKRLIPQSRKNL